VTKLETAWLHPDVVTITPIDDEVGVSTFGNWISILDPIWIPVLIDGDNSSDAYQATERIGTSITESIARMWGADEGSDLFERMNGTAKPVKVVESNQVVLASSGLTPGSTVSTEKSKANLVAPTF
jgi:hypothetical protein